MKTTFRSTWKPATQLLLVLMCLAFVATPVLADESNSQEKPRNEVQTVEKKFEIKDQRSVLQKAYDYINSLFKPAPMHLAPKKQGEEKQNSLAKFIEEADSPKVIDYKPANQSGAFAWEKSVATKQAVKITSTETDISQATYCEIVNPCPQVGQAFKTYNGAITFKWETMDITTGGCDNVIYDLLYDTQNPPQRVEATGLASAQHTTSIVAGGNGVTNYWQVRVRNTQTGFVDESSVFSFSPFEIPTVAAGGYLNSSASESAGGTMNFLALTLEPTAVNKMELWYAGNYVDDMTAESDPGVYSFDLPIGPGSIPSGTPIVAEARAIGYNGLAASTIYPYLTAECLGDICGPNGGPNAELGRQLELQVAAFERNSDVGTLMKRFVDGETSAVTTKSTRVTNDPRVWLAGFWDTKLTDAGPNSGLVRMVAYVPTPGNGNPITSVDMYLDGAPLGLSLSPGLFGAPAADLYSFEFDFGPGGFADLCNTPLNIQLQATDQAGNVSDLWPNFVIE